MFVLGASYKMTQKKRFFFKVTLFDAGCLKRGINPLNVELNPICHFLTLLGAHHILHVGR